MSVVLGSLPVEGSVVLHGSGSRPDLQVVSFRYEVPVQLEFEPPIEDEVKAGLALTLAQIASSLWHQMEDSTLVGLAVYAANPEVQDAARDELAWRDAAEGTGSRYVDGPRWLV